MTSWAHGSELQRNPALHPFGSADHGVAQTATVHDEAFGRMLLTVDPDGVEVFVNAAMTDLHGYQRLA